MKIRAKIAILPALAMALLANSGLGNGAGAVDPEGGERQKQARINAFGKSGMPSGKGANVNPQAAARQRSNSGGR